MNEVLSIIMIAIGSIMIGVGSGTEKGSPMVAGGCVMISMTLYYAIAR